MNVSSFVVVSNGSVDVDASRAKFDAALAAHIAERETENSNIASAVNTVFDQYRGKTLTMPSLTAYALQHLNFQPENHKALSLRVTQYVREQNGTTLQITKGKGGGVARVSDLPVPAAQ